MPPSRAFALVRHGRTAYNVRGLLNGDPAVAVGLDALGVAQVEALRERIRGLSVDLAVSTRFPRTAETLAILLRGREVRRVVCPWLDDIRVGVLEGQPLARYRSWRRRNDASVALPGGESRMAALARYAVGYELLLASEARFPLTVAHDLPIRLMMNAIDSHDPLDGPVTDIPNASLNLVAEEEMRAGLAVMRDRLEGAPQPAGAPRGSARVL